MRARLITTAACALAVVVSLLPAAPAHADAWSPSDWTGPTAGPPVPGTNLPPAPTPPSATGLPAGYDIPVVYEGQRTCTPTAKPGTQKLADLIKTTYGNTQTVWIPRACSIGGTSEHKEGRALDWMTSVRDPQQRANAEAFLSWLLGPDEFGNAYGRAIRLGVMYIGWNDRMWRGYGIDRGWTELKGCFATPETGSDTTCHRNHIHISLTWDGASGRTSFWDGTAVAAPYCPDMTTSAAPRGAGRGALVPVSPVTVLDSASGVGVPFRCRLSQDRESYQSHRVFPRVVGVGDVPADGVAAVQVEVHARAANAGSSIRVNTPGSANGATVVRVGINEDGTGSAVVPVATDGTIGVYVTTGAMDVRVTVTGYYPDGVDPVTLAATPQGSSAMDSDPASGDGGPPPPAYGVGPIPGAPPSTPAEPSTPAAPAVASAFVPLGSSPAYDSGTALPTRTPTAMAIGVPVDAHWVLASVSVAEASRRGILTAPGVSMRFGRGATTRLAVLPVTAGSVHATLTTSARVHVDVLGYWTGVRPPRVHASRPTAISRIHLDAGAALALGPLGTVAGLPARADRLAAVLVRVTARGASAGNVTALADGGQSPGTTSARVLPGRAQSTLLATGVSADYRIAVTANVDARVRVDVVGWVAVARP